MSSTRRRRYPTDLTDAEWGHLAPLLPSPEPRGRPRKHPVREVLDDIFHAVRGGCAWRLLPHDSPPWGTACYWFRRWRLDGLWQQPLATHPRSFAEGHQAEGGPGPEASVVIVDGQSVRIAEESGSNKGYDAARCVPGRKRHLLVDTSGLLLAERVTPANIPDSRGARAPLAGLAPLMPSLELIWADRAYAGEKLRSWCAEHAGWQLEVVPRNSDSSTFEVIPRRRVVERSTTWICRYRRRAKDYGRKAQTGECRRKVATIRLMLGRLG